IKFDINTKLLDMEAGVLEKRTYVFNNNNTHNSQFQGLLNFEPVRKVEGEVQYIFIFEDKFRTFANELYLSLLGKTYSGTFPGLKQMFNLEFSKETLHRIEIKNYSNETLEDVNKKVKQIRNRQNNKKIIGIFIEPNKDDSVNSPYFQLKYLFTKNDIPLQVVSYEKLSDRNTLKWSVANIGLQIFSKLGGVPWLVKPSNNNCLTIGLGSSHERSDSGEIKKYLAYAVCLDSSGLYKKLDVLATGANKSKYFSEFKNQLKKLLSDNEFKDYDKCVI